MEFTNNQKKIFEQIKLANRPLVLVELMDRHFRTRDLIVERDENNLKIENNSGVFIDDELKDLYLVFNYVQENKFIYCKEYAPSNYLITIRQNSIPSPRPDLSLLLNPFWGIRFSPTFALYDFIENGYKTQDDIKLKEEREERKKEKEAREHAQKWTKITAIASIVFGLASAIIALIATGNRNVTILNPTKLPDTVKVMYYDPPKDTNFTK